MLGVARAGARYLVRFGTGIGQTALVPGSALPTTDTRPTAPLECANDAEDGCASWSSGHAHPSRTPSRDTVTPCVFVPRPAVAGRSARVGTGATPPLDAPVVALARVCIHTHGPGEVAPDHGSLREGRRTEARGNGEHHESRHCGAVQHAPTALGFDQVAGTTSRSLSEV